MSPAASLRDRMRRSRVLGLFAKLADRVSIEVGAEALDFIVVDREHSQLSESAALDLIAHGSAIGIPTLLRLPEVDRGEVNRALEAGAAGIQLSSVRSPEAVEALRGFCEYAPGGERSISLGHHRGRYGATQLRDYLDAQMNQPIVVAQIESDLDPTDYWKICEAKPDVAFVGTTDLLVDCQLDSPLCAEKIGQIAAAASSAGVVFGGFGIGERSEARYLINDSDTSLLAAAIRNRAEIAQKEEMR